MKKSLRLNLAGKELKIKTHITHPQVPTFGGSTFYVEDYWDTLTGKSWKVSEGNPACIVYALRIGLSEKNYPIDDEVLYGKVGELGHLVHITELEINEKEK